MSIATAMDVQLSIPRPYNGGEWRLSRQMTGPRGSKHWEIIQSMPATGGEYHTRLPEGVYKETYWINGRPSSSTFTIKKAKTYTDEQGEQWSTWRLIEDDSEGRWPGGYEENYLEREAGSEEEEAQ